MCVVAIAQGFCMHVVVVTWEPKCIVIIMQGLWACIVIAQGSGCRHVELCGLFCVVHRFYGALLCSTFLCPCAAPALQVLCTCIVATRCPVAVCALVGTA